MAKTQGPLMSLGASGSIASTLTFATWKGRPYVRQLVQPANPKSAGQVAVRAAMSFLTKAWPHLSPTEQQSWKGLANSKNISEFNAFVGNDMIRFTTAVGPLKDPGYPAGAVEAAPTAGAAGAGVKQLKITWVDSVGADDWCTLIYRSTTNGFSPTFSNLVACILHGVELWQDTPLITGTPYYYRIQGCEKGGTLGTMAAQFTGTPT